jgi:hypothetical protein
MALIIGSATPDKLLHLEKWPEHPNSNAFDKSGSHLKLLKAPHSDQGLITQGLIISSTL